MIYKYNVLRQCVTKGSTRIVDRGITFQTARFCHEKVLLNYGRSVVQLRKMLQAVVIGTHSCFNTMFSFNSCLKGPHGKSVQFLVTECDEFEDCDVTSEMS